MFEGRYLPSVGSFTTNIQCCDKAYQNKEISYHNNHKLYLEAILVKKNEIHDKALV